MIGSSKHDDAIAQVFAALRRFGLSLNELGGGDLRASNPRRREKIPTSPCVAIVDWSAPRSLMWTISTKCVAAGGHGTALLRRAASGIQSASRRRSGTDLIKLSELRCHVRLVPARRTA
jgi:hypothetical protein